MAGKTVRFDFDVLIAGSGAAGLTLAIDLARRGISLCLIEKMSAPFRGSRGKGIQPRSQEILEDLGMLDRIAAAGGEYPPQREYRGDGSYQDSRVMESNAATPLEPYPNPLLAPQFRTEEVMRDRLAELGSRPRFGWELRSFQQDATGVTVCVIEPLGARNYRVRYLVGTDGGRSFVRGALGVDFPGKTLGIRAIVADVTLAGPRCVASVQRRIDGNADFLLSAASDRSFSATRPDSPGRRYRPIGQRLEHAHRRAQPAQRYSDPVGSVGFGIQHERALGDSLSCGPGISRGRCRAHSSSNRRTGPQYQPSRRLQPRLEARGGVARCHRVTARHL